MYIYIYIYMYCVSFVVSFSAYMSCFLLLCPFVCLLFYCVLLLLHASIDLPVIRFSQKVHSKSPEG